MFSAVRRRPLAAFFVLAFALSWYPWFLALARGTTTGPNPLGPLVAGLIVSGIAFGKGGTVAYLRRIVRGGVGLRWYLAGLGLPLAVCALAAAVVVATGTPAPTLVWNWKDLLERFVFIFLFIGLGEEPGWRGFAVEQLQKTRTPLAASLVLAPVWAIWHAPLIGNEFAPPIVAPFVLSVFGATFFLTWLYDGTRGSVLLPALTHAAVNSAGAGFVFPAFSADAQVRLWWVYSILWLALGLALVARSRVNAVETGRGAVLAVSANTETAR